MRSNNTGPGVGGRNTHIPQALQAIIGIASLKWQRFDTFLNRKRIPGVSSSAPKQLGAEEGMRYWSGKIERIWKLRAPHHVSLPTVIVCTHIHAARLDS